MTVLLGIFYYKLRLCNTFKGKVGIAGNDIDQERKKRWSDLPSVVTWNGIRRHYSNAAPGMVDSVAGKSNCEADEHQEHQERLDIGNKDTSVVGVGDQVIVAGLAKGALFHWKSMELCEHDRHRGKCKICSETFKPILVQAFEAWGYYSHQRKEGFAMIGQQSFIRRRALVTTLPNERVAFARQGTVEGINKQSFIRRQSVYSLPRQGKVSSSEFDKFATSSVSGRHRQEETLMGLRPFPSISYFNKTVRQADETRRQIGLGMVLKISTQSHGAVCVEQIVAGWAAAKSGKICVGDVVLTIDGKSVHEWKLDDVKRLCLGLEGTSCALTIQRGIWKYEVSLIRVHPGSDGASNVSQTVPEPSFLSRDRSSGVSISPNPTSAIDSDMVEVNVGHEGKQMRLMKSASISMNIKTQEMLMRDIPLASTQRFRRSFSEFSGLSPSTADKSGSTNKQLLIVSEPSSDSSSSGNADDCLISSDDAEAENEADQPELQIIAASPRHPGTPRSLAREESKVSSSQRDRPALGLDESWENPVTRTMSEESTRAIKGAYEEYCNGKMSKRQLDKKIATIRQKDDHKRSDSKGNPRVFRMPLTERKVITVDTFEAQRVSIASRKASLFAGASGNGSAADRVEIPSDSLPSPDSIGEAVALTVAVPAKLIDVDWGETANVGGCDIHGRNVVHVPIASSSSSSSSSKGPASQGGDEEDPV